MHPLELQYSKKFKGISREKEFWETIGNCMASKKAFFLESPGKPDWVNFMPDHGLIIFMDGQAVVNRKVCNTWSQFTRELENQILKYNKINPYGMPTNLETRINLNEDGKS